MLQTHGILQSQKEYELPTIANALSWNFGSGHIDLGASLNKPGADAFSIIWWAKLQQPTGNNGLWGNQATSSPFSGMACWTDSNDSGNMYFEIVRTGASALRVKFPFTVFPGDWHHYIMTYDGSKSASGVNMYLDGVELSRVVVQDNFTGTVNTFGTSKIGSTILYGNMQNSSMDEFCSADQHISQQEATGVYNSGLISDMSQLGAVTGWWRADNDGGGISPDEIGAADGTYIGTVNPSGDKP